MGSQNNCFCFFLIPFISPSFASVYPCFMRVLNRFNNFLIWKLGFFIQEKSILHFSYLMVLGSKKRVKIPETALDKISCHLFKTHFCPYFPALIYRLVDKMGFEEMTGNLIQSSF